MGRGSEPECSSNANDASGGQGVVENGPSGVVWIVKSAGMRGCRVRTVGAHLASIREEWCALEPSDITS